MSNNSKPNQARKILNYLMEHETITGNEAEEYFACKRLPSRISELKKAGHFIICERINGKNRFGEKCHWGQYRLIKDMEGANEPTTKVRKKISIDRSEYQELLRKAEFVERIFKETHEAKDKTRGKMDYVRFVRLNSVLITLEKEYYENKEV